MTLKELFNGYASNEELFEILGIKEQEDKMEQKIKVFFGNKTDGTLQILNKLETAQKVLELLETQQVTSVEIIYKKREPACTANSND